MTVTIRGALVLHEQDFTRQGAANARGAPPRFRIITLKGQESSPPDTREEVEIRRAGILSLADVDEALPHVFSVIPELDGWYRTLRTQANIERHGTTDRVGWTMTLERVGRGLGDSQLESSLTGVLRTNDHGISPGERWHALPAAAVGVHYGADSPAELTRTTVDGDAMTVFRDIPDATPARYLLDPSVAAQGQALVTIDGAKQVGLSAESDPTDWQLDNGLVRLRDDGSQAFTMSVSNGAVWESEITVRARWSSTALGVPDAVQMIRNDMHLATVRLVWTNATIGRISLDLSLRRGAHHASFVLRSSNSGTLRLEVNDTSASNQTGYRRAAANDADGNRWMIGSAATIVTSGGSPWFGIQATATTLVGFVGFEFAGSGAAAGNTGDDVRDQYLEDRAELVRVVAP